MSFKTSEIPGVISAGGMKHEKELMKRVTSICDTEEAAQAFFNMARVAYVEKLMSLIGRVEDYDVFFVLVYKITKKSIAKRPTIHEAYFSFDKYSEVHAWLSVSPQLYEKVLIRDFDSGKFRSHSVEETLEILSKMMKNKDEVNRQRRKKYGNAFDDDE